MYKTEVTPQFQVVSPSEGSKFVEGLTLYSLTRHPEIVPWLQGSVHVDFLEFHKADTYEVNKKEEEVSIALLIIFVPLLPLVTIKRQRYVNNVEIILKYNSLQCTINKKTQKHRSKLKGKVKTRSLFVNMSIGHLYLL